MSILIQVLFLAIIVVSLVWGYKRSQDNHQYDERQELLQNRGYRYATYAMFLTSAAAVLFGEELSRLLNVSLVALVIMLAGLVTYVFYAVLHDAYFPLNKNNKLVSAGLLAFLALIQLLVVVKNLLNHSFSAYNGGMNLLLFAAFTIILIVILYKKHLDKKEAKE